MPFQFESSVGSIPVQSEPKSEIKRNYDVLFLGPDGVFLLLTELYRKSGLDLALHFVEGDGQGFPRIDEETALVLGRLKEHFMNAKE